MQTTNLKVSFKRPHHSIIVSADEAEESTVALPQQQPVKASVDMLFRNLSRPERERTWVARNTTHPMNLCAYRCVTRNTCAGMTSGLNAT